MCLCRMACWRCWCVRVPPDTSLLQMKPSLSHVQSLQRKVSRRPRLAARASRTASCSARSVPLATWNAVCTGYVLACVACLIPCHTRAALGAGSVATVSVCTAASSHTQRACLGASPPPACMAEAPATQAYLASWGPWYWLPLGVLALGAVERVLQMGQQWCPPAWQQVTVKILQLLLLRLLVQ